MTNKFDTIHNAMKELEEKIKKQGQIMFFEVAKEIFDKYPTVRAFSWNQYTPYFNDGDECVFSVNSNDIRIIDNFEKDDSEKSEEDDYIEDDSINCWYIKRELEQGKTTKTVVEYGSPRPPTDEELKKIIIGNDQTYPQNISISSTWENGKSKIRHVYDVYKTEVPITDSERAAVEFSDLLASAGEHVLLAIFGDHAEITIYRDGTSKVDGYNHE